MKPAWLLLILFVTFCLCSPPALQAQEKWRGVDETVVNKVAQEHGREARPLLPAAGGDLLPFFFLVAGGLGGFAAGYYWRRLTTGRRGR